MHANARTVTAGLTVMITTAHSAGWAAAMAHDIAAAELSVTITALSMLPPRHDNATDWATWWRALTAAAARGARINVALPTPHIAHPATLRNAAAAAALRDIGAAAVLLPATNLLHAKSALIDANIAWVGSGNMTAAAAHHNIEIYIRTTDHRTALQLEGLQRQIIHAGITTP